MANSIFGNLLDRSLGIIYGEGLKVHARLALLSPRLVEGDIPLSRRLNSLLHDVQLIFLLARRQTERFLFVGYILRLSVAHMFAVLFVLILEVGVHDVQDIRAVNCRQAQIA